MNPKKANKLVYMHLEMITRIYTLDSKKNRQECCYWLNYAFKVAGLLQGEKVKSKPEDILG